MPQALKNFAIQDTENVTKIFLADRSKNQVLLERKSPSEWILNKKYRAFKPRMDILLETINSVEMKNPLNEKSKKTFLKEMILGSTKVEIYKNGNSTPAKTYYVGSTTADQLGTIMLIEGSTDPYVTWIPGFDGYLTTRFEATEKGWRGRDIYRLLPTSIKEVKYEYPAHPEESFLFTSNGKDFKVESGAKPGESRDVQPTTAKNFLLGFTNVQYEAFYTASPHEMDSVRALVPVVSISVKADGADVPVVKFYNIKAEGHLEMAGRNPFDKSRFLAILSSNPKEILYVQIRNIQRLMVGYKDMMK